MGSGRRQRRVGAVRTEQPVGRPEPGALYARVSTEEQRDTDTIDAQVSFLRRFADLQGLPVAGEYLDEGVSGAVPLQNRPDGRRLLADAEAGRFKTVLFLRVSRLGRKLTVVVDAHDALAQLGVDVRVAEGTTPAQALAEWNGRDGFEVAA